MKVRIYTDGSCNNNGGYREDVPVIGSYGFVAVNEDDIILTEYVEVIPNRTNNQMELSGILAAFSSLPILDFEECTIYSDSEYAIKSANSKNPKKNLDLIRSLRIFTKRYPNVKLEWVKGHSEDKWNNYIDQKILDARTKK